jgi:hypothetical protein
MKSNQIITFIMASLLVSGALAADSGNNTVYIDQTNADQSTVSITQTGSNNNVGDSNFTTGTPFVIDGNSMNLTVEQNGMNNSITGNFIGGNSTANILQDGNTNSTNLNMGNFGTSSGVYNLTVTGSSNNTNLNIGITKDASNYKYGATLTGSNNNLTSNINSKNTDNMFIVTGSTNTITTTQIGANGTFQTGGHNINSNIIGSNNSLTVLQDGTTNPNGISINVTGNSTTTNIIQQ